MEKYYYNLLDDLIEHYKLIQNVEPIALHTEYYNKVLSNNKATKEEAQEATDKLVRSGYIRHKFAGERGNYYITFEGYLFIRDGKYKAKRVKEWTKAIFQFLSSFAIALAAVMACLYYLGVLRVEPNKSPDKQIIIQQK